MEQAWSRPWEPTCDYEQVKDTRETYNAVYEVFRSPTEPDLPDLERNLRSLTQNLQEHPYSPSAWSGRAKVLLQLQYPEFAASDLFKALTLVRLSRRSDSDLAKSARRDIGRLISQRGQMTDMLATRTAYSTLDQLRIQTEAEEIEKKVVVLLTPALLLSNNLHYGLDVLNDNENLLLGTTGVIELRKTLKAAISEEERSCIGLTATSTTSRKKQADHEHEDLKASEDQRSGTVLLRPYPWLTPEHCRHNLTTIGYIQDNLIESTASTSRNGAMYTIRRSDLRKNVDSSADVFGIFATTAIAPSSCFMEDRSLFCSVNDPHNRRSSCRQTLGLYRFRAPCCSDLYCTDHCRRKAETHFHDAICGKDVSRFETSDHNAMLSADRLADNQLMLRALSCAVRWTDFHPLDAPFLNRLTPRYHAEPFSFSFTKDIVRRLEMLEALGVDIYANHKFDTWVLFALQTRISNNVRGNWRDGTFHLAINPIYTFFNHSCDPNVDLEEGEAYSTLRMITRRHVKKDEELFISYLDDEDLDLPYEERQAKLRPWTGGSCQCARCKREVARTSTDNVDTDEEWSPSKETFKKSKRKASDECCQDTGSSQTAPAAETPRSKRARMRGL